MNFFDLIYFCFKGLLLNRNDKLYFYCYKMFLKLIWLMDNGSYVERGWVILYIVRRIWSSECDMEIYM